LEAALSKLTFQVLIINQDMIKHGRMQVMELTGQYVNSFPFFLPMVIFYSSSYILTGQQLAIN
jgi:hypothetical protein